MSESQITSGGPERIQAAADLIGDAFKEDPTTAYLLCCLTPEQQDAYRSQFFRTILTAAASNGATFDEISGWQSCGVILPPGSIANRVRPSLYPAVVSLAWSIGFAGCQRAFLEMPRETTACKAKALRDGEKYFYVFFLATRGDARERGLCSAVVKDYQARAAKERAAIYMEAATEYCWRLYERLGFVTIGEAVMGKGKAAADGSACVGGPGVKLWGMIWRPEMLG